MTAEVKKVKEVKEETQVESKGYKTITLPISKKVVSINQMTGIEEEILTDSKTIKNAGKLITELLTSIIVEMDGKSASRQDVKDLLIGDRDFILVELRKISLGEIIESSFVCPNCGEKIHDEVSLDDLKVKEVGEDFEGVLTIELIDGYKDREGNKRNKITVKYPDGNTQEKTAVIMSQNIGRGNTELIKECIIEMEGISPVTRGVIKSLTKRDRDIILSKIDKNSPGVNFNVESVCNECGESFETMLDLTNFFVLNL